VLIGSGAEGRGLGVVRGDAFDPLPAALTDGEGAIGGVLDEVQADRLSARFQGGRESFRIVLGRTGVDVSLVPPADQPTAEAQSLLKKKILLPSRDWVTVRLTFAADTLTLHIGPETFEVKHPRFAQPKTVLHLIAFDGRLGLKNFKLWASPP
jgi:hypothetical protein